MSLLDYKPYDKEFYETELKPYLPKKIIDCHTHIWYDGMRTSDYVASKSGNTWPGLVARVNPVEDLIETNRELFPDNEVVSCLYSMCSRNIIVDKGNEYVSACAAKYGFPALYLAHPSEPADSVEKNVLSNPAFKGLKVYLNFAPDYIPADEIRIFDFLTPEHLALADRHGWVVQLHIARPKRLADPVNYVQIREIEEKYPNLQLIIAHLGRAYADEDVGNSLEYLKGLKKTMWDFTANTNQHVMELVLEQYGPERFMYGSDFPIFRMKARRHSENGFYINEIPAGSLGDSAIVLKDKHMREIAYPEAEKITFFIYEEMASAIRALKKLGYGKRELELAFHDNAARIFGI